MDVTAEGAHAAPTSPNTSNRRGSASSRRASEPGTPLCTYGSCTEVDGTNNKLKCDKCDKFFHYRCTGLPVFQIHHFLCKGYRKFICESCTKVTENLKTIILKPPLPDYTKQALEYEKTIKEKQLEVDTLAETNRMLHAKIKELTSNIAKSQKDLKKEKEKHSKLQAEVHKENAQEQETCNNKETLTTLTSIMEEKLEEIQNNLKSVILNEVSKNNSQLEEKINSALLMNKSYADTVTNSETSNGFLPEPIATKIDLRAVIREERNTQLAEESDKKMRACNLILHGNIESSGEIPERKLHDKNFIESFFRDIGVESSYKSITRLGIRASNVAKRPIKVVMQNEAEKDLVLARLNNLKGKETYKGISITEDYSTLERKTIKEWADKAKNANLNEPKDSLYEWKARGSPKNGMRLKKFRKRTPSA